MKLLDKILKGKKIGETKVGKALTPVARVADAVFAGGMVFNILDENKAPKGKIDAESATVSVAVWIVLASLVASFFGWITPEQVEQVKNVVTP